MRPKSENVTGYCLGWGGTSEISCKMFRFHLEVCKVSGAFSFWNSTGKETKPPPSPLHLQYFFRKDISSTMVVILPSCCKQASETPWISPCLSRCPRRIGFLVQKKWFVACCLKPVEAVVSLKNNTYILQYYCTGTYTDTGALNYHRWKVSLI